MYFINVFLVSTLGYLALSELFEGNYFYKIAFLLLCIVLSNLEILIRDEKIKAVFYSGLCIFSLFYPLIANVAIMLAYTRMKSVKHHMKNSDVPLFSAAFVNTAILLLLSLFALYHDMIVGNEIAAGIEHALEQSTQPHGILSGGLKGRVISLQMLLFGVFSTLYSHFEYEYSDNQKHIFKTLDEKETLKISMQERLKELNYKNKVDIYNEILSERNRIAKEIHDNVGHRISSAIFKIGAISTINEDEAVRELVEGLEEDLHLSMNDIKRSIYDIYDDVGNLRSYLSKLAEEFGFCKVHLDMNVEDLKDAQLKLVIISIVKEALNNIAKHSNASSVNIKFSSDGEHVKLLIVDNGQIYKKKEDGILTDHLGLRGMKETVEQFGGRFRFVFKNGFRIYVSIPIIEIGS